MKKYFNLLHQSMFSKNVFTLFKGIFLAQLIGIIGNLLLAKLYGESAYGFYSIFLSFTGILTVFYTLNFEQTIILSESDKERSIIIKGIVFFSIILIIFLIALALFLIFLSYNKINFFLYFLVIFGGFLIALKSLFEMYYTQKSAYKLLSSSKIWLIIVTIIFQFVLVNNNPKTGLAIGFALSNLLLITYFYLKSGISISLINKSVIYQIIKRFKSILILGFPSTLINNIANNMLPLLIASFFTVAETGVYALSLKIVITPMFLISASISPVFFQKGNELYNSDSTLFHSFLKKIINNNLIFIGFILLLINLVGVPLLSLFFGDDWVNLNWYILILSFYVLARSCYNPISYVSTIVNKLHIELYFNIYLITVNLLAILLGFYFDNLFVTISLFSLLNGIGYIALVLYFLNLNQFKNLLP